MRNAVWAAYRFLILKLMRTHKTSALRAVVETVIERLRGSSLAFTAYQQCVGLYSILAHVEPAKDNISLPGMSFSIHVSFSNMDG